MGWLAGSAQHRVLAPKGQSWSLGSATACWQGQGNAIRPWEKASCPPLPPLGGNVRSQKSECPGVGTVLPLASHKRAPQECWGPCGSHRGLQGMCRRQKLISGREGDGGHSLPVVMLLLLLNLISSPEQRGAWKAKALPLRSSPHSHWALVPPLEAITPSRLQPLDPWGGQGPLSAPTSRGGGQHCLYALQSNNTIFIFGFGQGGAGPWGKPGPRALGCTETLF